MNNKSNLSIHRIILPTVFLLTLTLVLFSSNKAIYAQGSEHITLIPDSKNSLNQPLLKVFQANFKDYKVHLSGTVVEKDLSGFMKALNKYQQTNQSKLSSIKDNEKITVAGKSLNGADVKRLIVSKYVIIPRWSYSPIQLTGPHKGGDSWHINMESKLTVKLITYEVKGASIKEVKSATNLWPLTQQFPIKDIKSIISAIKIITGKSVDINKPEQRPAILDYLKNNAGFKRINEIDPAEIFLPVAQKSVGNAKAASSIPEKLALSSAPVAVKSPSPTQTPQPTSDGNGAFDLHVKLGTTSLNFIPANFSTFPEDYFFVPQAHIEGAYDIGQFMGAPGLDLTLSTSVHFPWDTISVPGIPLQIMSGTGELGVLYNIHLPEPWGLYTGIRGGAMWGILIDVFGNSGVIPFGSLPLQFTFGGTAIVGGTYKFSDSLALGLEAGFRYYIPALPWSVDAGFGFPQPLQAPVATISSLGPVINVSLIFGL